MWRRLRKLLTFVALLALTALSTGVAAGVYFYHLPDPEFASGREVFYWLVTRDLENESPAVQQKLLRRVEAELRKGIDNLDEASDELTEDQRVALEHNVEFLARLWLFEKAEMYAELPARERQAFLDSQIEDVQTWGAAQQLAERGMSGNAGSDLMRFSQLLERVNRWIEEAPPEKQQQVRRFVSAVQGRILLQRFNRFNS